MSTRKTTPSCSIPVNISFNRTNTSWYVAIDLTLRKLPTDFFPLKLGKVFTVWAENEPCSSGRIQNNIEELHCCNMSVLTIKKYLFIKVWITAFCLFLFCWVWTKSFLINLKVKNHDDIQFSLTLYMFMLGKQQRCPIREKCKNLGLISGAGE